MAIPGTNHLGTSGAPLPATPFPSAITVSGLGSQLTDIAVTITGYSHSYSPDVGSLILGPTGQNVMLLGQAGNVGDPVTYLTFKDSAARTPQVHHRLSQGDYQPVDYSSGLSWSGGRITTWTTTLSSFHKTNPNGTWNLYVQDFDLGDTGSITGWSMEVSAVPEPRLSAAIGAAALAGFAVSRRVLRRR